jgi:peroxiredoxin
MKGLFRTVITACAGSLAMTALLCAAPQSMTIGARAENFTLRDPAGSEHALFQNEGEKPKATVVIFIATQCPVSNAYNERMAALAKEYAAKGVRFLGVNANKQESAVEVAQHAQRHGLDFTIVKDPNNTIADKWGAMVTPEAYVLDADGVLRYHGRIDDSQNPTGVKSQDLKAALDAVLAGREPERSETKAFGCTIKRV